jgi:hypothetical protein
MPCGGSCAISGRHQRGRAHAAARGGGPARRAHRRWCRRHLRHPGRGGAVQCPNMGRSEPIAWSLTNTSRPMTSIGNGRSPRRARWPGLGVIAQSEWPTCSQPSLRPSTISPLCTMTPTSTLPDRSSDLRIGGLPRAGACDSPLPVAECCVSDQSSALSHGDQKVRPSELTLPWRPGRRRHNRSGDTTTPAPLWSRNAGCGDHRNRCGDHQIRCGDTTAVGPPARHSPSPALHQLRQLDVLAP